MNLDFDGIKTFWKTSLQPISPKILEGLSLSDNTNYFLTVIGLPKDASRFLNNALEVNFYSDKSKIIKKTSGGTDYCVIGDDLGTTFCISLNDNSVYSIDFKNKIPDSFCFVNSSTQQFIYCLQIFSEFQQFAKTSEDDEKEIVKSMILKFKTIDPKCLQDESTWWSGIVNQSY